MTSIEATELDQITTPKKLSVLAILGERIRSIFGGNETGMQGVTPRYEASLRQTLEIPMDVEQEAAEVGMATLAQQLTAWITELEFLKLVAAKEKSEESKQRYEIAKDKIRMKMKSLVDDEGIDLDEVLGNKAAERMDKKLNDHKLNLPIFSAIAHRQAEFAKRESGERTFIVPHSIDPNNPEYLKLFVRVGKEIFGREIKYPNTKYTGADKAQPPVKAPKRERKGF